MSAFRHISHVRSLPKAIAMSGLLVGVGVFSFVGAADAQPAAPKTLYVSQTGLDSGSCTSSSPCATVTYALTKAASGATIEVSGTINDHVTISSPVTITTWPGGPAGSPAVLDGTTTGNVVLIDGSGAAALINLRG